MFAYTNAELLAMATQLTVVVAYVLQRLNANKVNVTLAEAERVNTLIHHRVGHVDELLNGNVEEIKRVYMVGMLRLAQITGNEDDRQLAEKATAIYRDHKTPERTFLIIEDDDRMARLTSEIIANLGHRAELANSAEVAIGMMKNRSYPIAFIDLRLPTMKGWDLMEYISDYHPGTHLIALCTEIGDLSNVAAGLYSGFIRKPPTISAIRKSIETTNLLNPR